MNILLQKLQYVKSVFWVCLFRMPHRYHHHLTKLMLFQYNFVTELTSMVVIQGDKEIEPRFVEEKESEAASLRHASVSYSMSYQSMGGYPAANYYAASAPMAAKGLGWGSSSLRQQVCWLIRPFFNAEADPACQLRNFSNSGRPWSASINFLMFPWNLIVAEPQTCMLRHYVRINDYRHEGHQVCRQSIEVEHCRRPVTLSTTRQERPQQQMTTQR